MNFTLFISLLFGLQIFYWFVGKQGSKKNQAQNDYFLAGKKVSFFPLMMTFLATQVGGGLILGTCDEAYTFGWQVLLCPLGAALGLIMLGLGIGKKLAQFNVSTVAEILEVVYKSPRLKKVASVLSIISLFMILVAQVIASQKFMSSLGLHNITLFILFWAIVIIYTARGGLKAVISTDIAQALFFIIVFLVCFGYAFYTNPINPKFTFIHSSLASTKLWGWFFMPLLFMVIEQDMGQRCFAAGSSKILSKATIWAGVITFLICIVPLFFGCLASYLQLEVPQGTSVFMKVTEAITNPTITAFVGCAVLAAIISTATSLINAISSNISHDFNVKLLQTKRSQQIMTTSISIAAIFFAFYFDNIVDLLIQSYELSVSCLFVAIFIALFKREGHFLSALLSIIFGAFGFCLFRIVSLPFPKELGSILLSFLGFGLGELKSFVQWKLRRLT